MTLSKKLSLLGAAALMSIGVGATLSYTKATKSVVETSAAASEGGYTKITLDLTGCNWSHYTLWLNDFGYAEGYDQDRRNEFIESYYVNKVDDWNAQRTTKGYHYWSGGVNLATDFSNAVGVFALPSWITYCSIEAQNGDTSLNFNYLNNLNTASNNPTKITNGVGNSINIRTWHDGSNFGWTVSVTEESNQFSSFTIYRKYLSSSAAVETADSVTSYQYYLPSVGEVPEIAQHTTDGKWYQGTTYENAVIEFSTTSIIKTTSDKNVVAKYTREPHVYTITYDRNKNNGVKATQSKTEDISVNAYTPGTTPLNTADWSPSFAKRFKEWNTHYTGSGATYLAGATINANASFYLYYIEDWLSFRYSLDNEHWVNLVQNDTDKPSGVQVQFTPSSKQALHANSLIYLQYSDDQGSNWNTLTGVSFGGNYDTTTGIEEETFDTIYLKVTDSNTYECWVPGISERTILVCEAPDSNTGTWYSMYGKTSTQTETTVPVYIKEGQYLRRGYGRNAYETYLISSKDYLAFESVEGELAIKCLITGVYNVYNQAGEFNNWHDVVVERVDDLSAAFVASLMSDELEATCDDGGNTSMSSLIATWGSTDSTGIRGQYNKQPDIVKAMISGVTNHDCDSDTDVIEFREKYDYILSKYGTTQLNNFMGRSITPLGTNNPLSIMFDATNGNSNATLIIVITIASLSVLGGYIFIRRRKATK